MLSGFVCVVSEQDKAVQALLVTCLEFIISLLELQPWCQSFGWTMLQVPGSETVGAKRKRLYQLWWGDESLWQCWGMRGEVPNVFNKKLLHPPNPAIHTWVAFWGFSQSLWVICIHGFLPLKSDFVVESGAVFETPLRSWPHGALKARQFSNSSLHKPYSAAKIQMVPFVVRLQVNNLSSDCVHIRWGARITSPPSPRSPA